MGKLGSLISHNKKHKKKGGFWHKFLSLGGGSLGMSIVVFIVGVLCALAGLIAALYVLLAPARLIVKARKQAIYNACSTFSSGKQVKYDDAYLQTLGADAETLEASIRIECSSYDTETYRCYIPTVPALDRELFFNSDADTVAKWGKYGGNVGQQANSSENKTAWFSDSNNTYDVLFFNMADDTFEYRIPWEYVTSVALAYKYNDPEIFNAMLNAKLDVMNDDGSFDDSKEGLAKFMEQVKKYSGRAYEFIKGAAGGDTGKLSVDTPTIKEVFGKLMVPTDYTAKIRYFGFETATAWGAYNVTNDVDEESLPELMEDFMENYLYESNQFVNSDADMDRLKSDIFNKIRVESISGRDLTTEAMPYITFNGNTYPTVLIRSVDNYCASYSDFDYVKVKLDGYVLRDSRQADTEDNRIYNTTYKLVHYKKTYNIEKILKTWEKVGIQEDMYDMLFEVLDNLCSSSGSTCYCELSEAYNYYINNGKELTVTYTSNDVDVFEFAKEYPTNSSSYRTLATRTGSNLLGNSMDMETMTAELTTFFAGLGWAEYKSGKEGYPQDFSPFSSDGAETWKFKHLPTIQSTLTLAQILYKNGMPYEDILGTSAEPAGEGRTFYTYMTHDTRTPVGYMGALQDSYDAGGQPYISNIYNNKYIWGTIRSSDTAQYSDNGVYLKSSLTGLSSAGFIDYILRRTLYIDRYDYRIRCASAKSTDQYSHNIFPTCTNLYDYADYRFANVNELMPGDLAFLSPTTVKMAKSNNEDKDEKKDDENKLVEDIDGNLVGIYIGDYFVGGTSGNNNTIQGMSKNFKGSVDDLSDKYIATTYGQKAHVFLVCCASNGTTLVSGVNKVILASDNVYIPGVATMDFEYFARYCDVVSETADNENTIIEDKELKDKVKLSIAISEGSKDWDVSDVINYDEMPVTFTAYAEWRTYEDVSESLSANISKGALPSYANEDDFKRYKALGYETDWYTKFCIARTICRKCLHEERVEIGFASTKNECLFGENDDGAISRAVDALIAYSDSTGNCFSTTEAISFAYGILGYGYGVTCEGGVYSADTNVATTAGIIEQLKAGTFFEWPIRDKYHYVTGFFAPYDASVPWAEGKMHYAVDLAITVGSPLENGSMGIYDRKYEQSGCSEYIAMADGVVDSVYFSEGGGWTITIVYSMELSLSSSYKHCNNIIVEKGQQVKKGELVAYGGNTGSETTGPHLHCEMRYGEKTYNNNNSNTFGITDLFNYNWASSEHGLTDEERIPKTYGQTEAKAEQLIQESETDQEE